MQSSTEGKSINCRACFSTRRFATLTSKILQGRTEFTPRANPETTSIRSILKTGDYTPSIGAEPLYEGPDVRNPMFDIPEGHVDVLAILNNGRTFPQDDEKSRRLKISNKIVPGKGYQLDHPVGYCDGSYNAICGRSQDSACLLYAHHDARGGLRFHEYSGWIVMNVPKVKEGLIMIKMETWHFADEVPVADGWKTVNNERHLRIHTTQETAVSHSRELKREQIPFCDDFHFDFCHRRKYHFMEFRTIHGSKERHSARCGSIYPAGRCSLHRRRRGK